MDSERRRRVVAAAGLVFASGCMEPPSATDEQDGDGAADGGDGSDDGDGTTGDGTADGGGGGANENATESETGETGDVDRHAEVWFRTDRVRQAINTFDVSVRVELRDSSRVRVSAGRVTETYTESGTYTEIARVDLGTTLTAEARTDGAWREVNSDDVPVEESSGF